MGDMEKEIAGMAKFKEKGEVFKGIFIAAVLPFILIFLAVLVFGINWIGTPWTTTYQGVEDSNPSISFNLSEHVNRTPEEEPLTFGFSGLSGSVDNISSTLHGSQPPSFYDWISIGSSTGILIMNSTQDNHTGQFNITLDAKTGGAQPQGAGARTFTFIVNATNDFPEFASVDDEYNLSESTLFIEFINGSDEEEHYPLVFDVNFTECTHAGWSNRTDCDLFNLTSFSNISSLINFTPTHNDVGTYTANLSVMDAGENASCPHAYCDADYLQNKTTYKTVIFNVQSSLSIDASDCQDKVVDESEALTCTINITTQLLEEDITAQSDASLRNYAGLIFNSSWFYSTTNLTSANNTISIDINVTPGKTEIGNWSVNFSVTDSSGALQDESILLYVNRTTNELPALQGIGNFNTSVDLLKTINITAFDNDLLIPDKLEGYNETLTFNVTVTNLSDSMGVTIPGFDVEITEMPVVSGGVLTNTTTAIIEFRPNSSYVGDYQVNLSVSDIEGALDFELFNMTIVSNSFPQWNESKDYTIEFIVNSTLAGTLNQTPIFINLTGEGWVWNDEGNPMTFSNITGNMTYFNLTSDGIINFTPYKEDVGVYTVEIEADSLGLTNSTTFTFNITNINSNVSIVDVENQTATEGESSWFVFVDVIDEDLKIREGSPDYEVFNFNWTILNSTGQEVDLFNFTLWDRNEEVNKSRYQATFVPQREDVGNYTVIINVTDNEGASDGINFTLVINALDHAPILSNLTNQSSSVNRTLYYRINASQIDDGFSNETGNTNFTFSYDFLNGSDIFNSTTFNSTTGEINITFNESHAGSYRINITVNATSTNLTDSGDFWLFVYDTPVIDYPAVSFVFDMQENMTSNLTFNASHTVGDNLTYEFYLDGVLRHNVSYFGNGSNITWEFTPNFTDETHGNYTNLTLVVISPVFNDFNVSRTWNANVTHANEPITFYNDISDKQTSHDNDITINLTQHFRDSDAFDIYNQTVNFTVSSNATENGTSGINWSVDNNWILTLSASSALIEELNVTGEDLNGSGQQLTNATSNNFVVEFTTPTTTSTPSSGGGGGSSSSSSCTPSWKSEVGKCNENRTRLITIYDTNSCEINHTEIQICLDEDLTTFEDRILFIEEFITEDFPECAEAKEMVEEARRFYDLQDIPSAERFLTLAIDSCMDAVSQRALFFSPEERKADTSIFTYLIILSAAFFVLGFLYYFYKRYKMMSSFEDYLGKI